MRNIVRATLIAATLVTAGTGCEIIAGVDRSQIPNGNGGSAGQDSSSSSSSSSSSGMAGAGGTAGAGGVGGAGGTAGAGGIAGAGGSGGIAGAGGGGMGGAGGGGPTCLVPADCPVVTNPCLEATCVAGVCGTNPLPSGSILAAQTIGDCQEKQCDGAGAEISVASNTDVPDDMNDCTSNVCTSGVPSNPPLTSGAVCGAMMNMVCDGAGACVGCNAPTDCAGTDTTCRTRTCVANTCGVSFAPQGTLDSNPTVGDCQVNECDGTGNSVSVPSATDLPNDNNACTSDVCSAGTPSNPPVGSGTACTQNGGSVCDGAGACVQCVTASTCPGMDTECQVRTCSSGMCGTSNTAAGTPTTTQTAGDCKRNQCDGAGTIVTVNDNVDLPVDGNSCTNDVCTSGMPSNPPVASGTMCGTNGLCNAAGQCVGCIVAADCPGSDTECQVRTCVANTCGVSNTAAGTPVASQMTGDCKRNQCDGMGAVVVAVDNADLPVDNNQCTSDVCTAGTPSNPPTGSGSACSQNGGAVCNGTGSCVQCVVASTCAGTDTECQVRTCNSNMCGVSNTAAGTAVSSQTPGDCQVNQCDGNGAIVSAPLNTDVPVDNVQCTSDVCTAGTPSNPPVTSGTACSQNGGFVCNATGSCVQCIVASTCPGMDTECQTRTCNANTCGLSFTAAGTAVASQTAGDCKVNQCNGSGAIVSAPLNSDLPIDGLDCTGDLCTAGVPSNPPVAVNTACSQNGGAFCDGAGACVSCTAASQCPGMDTECQTRTCIGGMCGTSFAASGTPVASQIPGDCLQNQCDGNGATVSAPLNTDLPVDSIDCTDDVCTAGVPSNPPSAVNTACSQNGGAFCDGAGACVACTAASQCPGMDTECQTRTCTMGVCGVSNAAAGTVVSSQTAGDCQRNQCDGNGAIVSLADDTDIPVDGVQCTSDVCTAGVPSNPPVAIDTACSQSGGAFCNGAGACVECNAAAQCAGVDTECQTKTCSSNTCGFSFAGAGTPIASQTPGDCQQNQCDGSGGIVTAALNTDLPVDGAECTDDVCTAGVPSNPPSTINTPCTQAGGSFCDGAGSCVECNAAAQCPGMDTECQTRACASNSCAFNYAASGTPVSMQTPGDCQQNQCDGAGNTVSAALNTDLPVDTNECTNDLCTAGVPSNPPAMLGTPCMQSGGTACNNAAACSNPPVVVSTTPAESATPVAGPTIDVTFSVAMNPSTLTANMNAGACVGNIQVSLDNFASCIAFAGSVMSPDNKTITLTAAPGLLVNRTYKIRVTTGAAAADGLTLASPFDMTNGFTTSSPALCGGGPIVISQVYGGGGNASAPFKTDFVGLHNRGSVTVNLVGWSIQYASATGSGWSSNKVDLTGSIAAGAYYLVAMGNGGGMIGADLPTADRTSPTNIDMSATAGKVALVASTTALSGTCPLGNPLIVDFVGFGTTANCSETAVAPAPSNTTAILRGTNGCTDANNNSTDFATATPNPRNSASPAVSCGCNGAYNESNNAVEADYCNVQFPTSLSVAAGAASPPVYGRVFETGITSIAGPAGNIVAQLGYGPPTANPQYQAGWNWVPATFNAQFGNDDEYQASFNAPMTPGSYRYVYRFSNDLGLNWTYCDRGADTGAGSNAGLSFEFADMPVLTVP